MGNEAILHLFFVIFSSMKVKPT